MTPREFSFEVASSNPAVCYYNPNYNYLDKSPSALPFSNKNQNKKTKQLLIQKLWRSYDVSSDYRTVELQTYIDEKSNR